MAIDGVPTHGEDFFAPKPDAVEEEATSKKQIWMIEDYAANAEAYMRAASGSLSSNHVNAEVVHFQEGETAVEKFRTLAEEGGVLPIIILMDYKLDQGVQDPKFRTGVEVIYELKSIADEHGIQLPEIVAFSSEKIYSDELLNAGATSSVDKSRDTYSYFKNLRI